MLKFFFFLSLMKIDHKGGSRDKGEKKKNEKSPDKVVGHSYLLPYLDVLNNVNSHITISYMATDMQFTCLLTCYVKENLSYFLSMSE